MTRHIGRYEILAELGRGGFGHVYRGLDPTVGRPVAIKTLAADGDVGMLTRFRNEATASGRLRHPNIITVYDFGEQDGVPFIVMELLEGRDLQQVIAGTAPVSPLNKVRIMTQIAAGLQHAHAHGIIHRDVKPANVMVLPDGSVKIMDFGIALITQATNSRLTPRGAMIGTFRYMAPEQFRNAQPDARSDIFAYGLIFYELLSGVHPFHAADAGALMYNILSVEPVPIGELVPDCPKELRAVIGRLLNKDPESRYQNLDDVLFDIEPSLGEFRRKRAQELLAEAEAAKAAQRFDTAQELVRQILELTPGDEGARRLREGIQVELRRQAIRPKVEALIRRGQEALAAGRPADAVERFESAIRLADVPEVVPLLEEARAGVERLREASRLASEAENAYKAGDPAGAAGLARQALELVPTEPLAKQVLAGAEGVLAEERRRAGLAEDLARAQRLIDIRSWDEASALIAKIDREFPGTPEVAVLAEKLRAGWAKEERERLLASGWTAARQQVQQGDLTGALATLEKLAAQYPESTDVEIMLGFVRLELETQTRRDQVGRSLAEAKAAAARREFEHAVNLLDAALARYPAEPDLQRERRSIAAEQREAARRAAAEKAIAAATAFRSQGRFREALPPLDDFLAAHGEDAAITNLRDAILKEQEAARRASELREFIHRARDLIAKGRAETATMLLKAPPPHLKDHPEVTQLLSVAQLQLREQAERKAALDKALTATVELRQTESFDEALQVLDAFQKRYGADTQVEEARNRLKQSEREKATKDLLTQGTELLAKDPAGATALFAAAPGYLRQQPEIQSLERAAWRAVEEQKARKAAAERAISIATMLRSQGHFSDALQPLDEFLATLGADPAITDLREAILKEQDAARRAAELREFLQRARDLMAGARAEDATALLQAAPSHLREHPEVVQLLATAQLQLQQQEERARAAKDLVARATAMLSTDPAGVTALLGSAPEYLRRLPEIQNLERAALRTVEEQRVREAAANQAIAAAAALRSQGRFSEALQPLDEFLASSGFDPAVAALRETILKEQEAARRAAEDLAARATAMLARDPAGAAALLAAAPDDLRRGPEITSLEQAALRAVEERRAREAAAGRVIASAAPHRSQGRFSEALRPLDDFLATYGADPAITGLREAILREQETARRAAELNELLSRAKNLMARDRAEEAIALLQASPPHLKDHPEVTQLLSSAQLQLRQRAERNAALDKALASALQLRQGDSLDEALRVLDGFQERYGADAQVEQARNQVKQAEREKATKDLIARVTPMLAKDPAGATALFGSAPEELRQQPEVQDLERTALRAVEELRAREAEAKLVREARELSANGNFAAALKLLDGAMNQFPGRLAAIRQEVVSAQERQERERHRDETIEGVHAFLEGHRYDEAAGALAALLNTEPGDAALLRLRAEVEARQAAWAAERKEREVQAGLARAKDMLAQAPDEAVRLLETLKRDRPDREDVAAALREAQERVKALEEQTLHRRAVEAIQAALDLRERDPKRALKSLKSLPEPLRSRPEVQAAAQESQLAIVEAGRTAAIASIEDLCARGKFRKARARQQEAVARFGTNPQLDELRTEIEAGLRSGETPGRLWPAVLGKPVHVAVVLGTAVMLAAVVWIFVHRTVNPPTPLMQVEIRTDPAGASISLGDRSCQTPNCRFDLPPGTYQVRTELDGYQPAGQTLTVGAEKRLYSFNLTLEPVVVPPPVGRPTGTLIVEAKIENALVSVDGKPLGRTDSAGRLRSTVEAAAHTVRVEEPGYQTPLEQKVRIGANRSQPLAFNLIPQSARLELRGAPAGVEVRANGVLVGRTEGSGLFSAFIPPGVQTLRLTEGPASREVPQTFGPGQTVSLEWANVAPAKVPAPPPPPPNPAEQAWEVARTTSDPAEVQAYLDKYPNGPHTPEAQSRLESLIWMRTNPNDPQSLRAYLSRFPRGPHARDAQLRLTELAWNGVDKKDIQALRVFLEQNADSIHKGDAQTLIDQLERQRQEAERLAGERAKQAAQQQLQAKAILSALDQFNAAFERKRPRDLKVIWPGAEKEYLDAIDQPGATFVMKLVPNGNPVVAGDTASITCELISTTNLRGRVTPRQKTVRVILKNTSGRWLIFNPFAANE